MSERPRHVWRLFLVIAVLIVFVWLSPWLKAWTPAWFQGLLAEVPPRPTWSDPALEALFSGLAFAGVIMAILLQQKELALQRRELRRTRREMRGQRRQLKAQAQTLRKQNFEDTFFRLLGLHNDIVGQITMESSARHPSLSGRECFLYFYERHLRNLMKDVRTQNEKVPELQLIERLWGAFFEAHGFRVGHYFRHLYHIIKFVSESDVPNKQFYTNLVRAQLSTYELVLLFYNCLGGIGRRKFKGLVEEYALLEQLVPENENVLLDPSHRSLYETGAFQERG